MKLIKQKILFLLFFYKYQPGIFRETNYLSYNFLYGLLGNYLPSSIRKATGELVQSGNLEKIVRNRKTFLRITSIGQDQLKRKFINFFSQSLVKRDWCLAILAGLPRGKAGTDRPLRLSLKNRGFCKYQDGVYLMPAKAEDKKNFKDLTGKVMLVFSKRLDFVDERQLVGRFWQVDDHFAQIQKFINREAEVLAKIEPKKILTKQEKKSISLLSEKFFILIKNTIGLPKNLLPADWPLGQACSILANILQKVE